MTTTLSTPTLNWAAPFEGLVEGASFTTRGRTVTEADVVAFAALTGDWHPLHTDAVWAKEGPFGQRISHGLLVVGIAAGLVPFDPHRVLALRGLRDVTFKRPVCLGQTISVQGRITTLRPIAPEAGIAGLAWSVVNEHAKVVCRAHVDVLWSRDDAPADDTPEPVLI